MQRKRMHTVKIQYASGIRQITMVPLQQNLSVKCRESLLGWYVNYSKWIYLIDQQAPFPNCTALSIVFLCSLQSFAGCDIFIERCAVM